MCLRFFFKRVRSSDSSESEGTRVQEKEEKGEEELVTKKKKKKHKKHHSDSEVNSSVVAPGSADSMARDYTACTTN